METFTRRLILRSIWISLVVIGIHSSTNCSRAQREVFDASVLQKWREYETFSHSLQGTARSKDLLNGKPQEERIKRVKQNRDCALVTLPDHRDKVFCSLANPYYMASIDLNPADRADAILKKYTPLPVDSDAVSPFDTAFYYFSRHFAFSLSSRLRQIVSRPSFKVVEIVRENLAGEDLIRVDHTYDLDKHAPNGDFHIRTHGSLWLDPKRCWCIRRCKSSHEETFRGERQADLNSDLVCEIIDHPSGFPILKSCIEHLKIINYKNKQNTDKEIKTDYELEVSDTVPDSEFTLSAFGLPEPPSVEPTKKNVPIYVWILIGAGVCAALALGFRYLASRTRARPAV